MIPEPCGVPDNSETGQGSGKKPDNDVPLRYEGERFSF